MIKDTSITIAVDAMGGDHGPTEMVPGAIAAARQWEIEIALVGDPPAIDSELACHDTDGLKLKIVPSKGVIEENQPPALALRQKPEASILVATGLVKKGVAQGLVTMGSTGAAMAAATVVLGTLEGLPRPALGGPIIGLSPHTVVIDVGTNLDCKPTQLLSFAVMGGVFATLFWNIQDPKVALLSVGSEPGKGNKQVRETTELFEKSPINFIGNIEANELPTGKADVVVADGFVGNIVMKLTEGIGSSIAALIAKRLKNNLPDNQIIDLEREIYTVNNVVETHGGGPLLGVDGICVIGHGRGKAESVHRAIGTAKTSIEGNLVGRQSDQLRQIQTQSIP